MWNCLRVVCDFELALHAALRIEFPGIQVQGCYFHFCQALWKHIRNEGLEALYRQDADVTKLCRKVMSIGYLPVVEVTPAFITLRQVPDNVALERLHPGIVTWMNYVDQTYIHGRNYPPALWNVHDRTMMNRTNNHCESHYSMWNQTLGFPHPKIWKFIRKLKDLQGRRTTMYFARDNGAPPQSPAKKWRDHEGAIVRLKEEFTQGVINLDLYWRGVTHHIANFE